MQNQARDTLGWCCPTILDQYGSGSDPTPNLAITFCLFTTLSLSQSTNLHVSYCYVLLFCHKYSEIDATVFQVLKITFRLFQKAIFAEPTKWGDCNDEINVKWSQSDVAMSIVPLYTSKLFHNNLKILIYSGDVDTVVPTAGKILNRCCNYNFM